MADSEESPGDRREAMTGLRYAIWGSAGHAKVLASLIRLRAGRIEALFDNADVPSVLHGVPMFLGVRGFDEWASRVGDLASVRAIVAIGGHRGRIRLDLQRFLLQRGLTIDTLVHPDASVCDSATLGAGTQILARAVVAADACIGEAGIVNHAASVDHECVLGDGVHVAPGATLCGCVTVGDNVMIGAGAVVLPRLRIGADAMVGAGAIVTRDVAAGATVIGNPARTRNA